MEELSEYPDHSRKPWEYWAKEQEENLKKAEELFRLLEEMEQVD
jgi:hypothetical protein